MMSIADASGKIVVSQPETVHSKRKREEKEDHDSSGDDQDESSDE
jgi:hypothetical protein